MTLGDDIACHILRQIMSHSLFFLPFPFIFPRWSLSVMFTTQCLRPLTSPFVITSLSHVILRVNDGKEMSMGGAGFQSYVSGYVCLRVKLDGSQV